jgi:hypothetical protein
VEREPLHLQCPVEMRAPKLALVLLLAAACAFGAASATAAPPHVHGALTFTRPDGTTVRFGAQIRIWCGRWEPDVPVRAIHVLAGNRRSGTFWLMSAVLDDVKRPTTVRLPNSFTSSRPEGALLFAVDRGENELSSDVEEARGKIVFERAGCRPKPYVTFSVDATLGSEFFDGDPLRAEGRLAVRAR